VAVGVLLAAIMTALRSPWMLIPAGLLLGNGFLMAYFALSGRWSDWAFFWPCEPALVAAAILAPFWFARRGEQGRARVRTLGVLLMLAAAAVACIILLTTVLLTLTS